MTHFLKDLWAGKVIGSGCPDGCVITSPICAEADLIVLVVAVHEGSQPRRLHSPDRPLIP